MKKHCSVVVLYNPIFSEISEFLNQLINSKYFLFIIDNSEKKLGKEFDIFINNPSVRYKNFNKNKGLAFAQNQGINEAILRSFETITLFDQDSFINSKNYIKLVETFNQSKYDIMSPLVVSKKDHSKVEESLKINFIGWPSPTKVIKSKMINPTDIIIASGLTCSLKIFKDVGLFDEDFFIDYLDIEWCLRAKSMGKKIAVNRLITLFHSIGIGQEDYVLFKPQIHPPERTFYQFKNNFALFNKSHVPILYCLRELFVNLLSLIIKIFLKKKNRKEHFFYFWDAVKSSIGSNKKRNEF